MKNLTKNKNVSKAEHRKCCRKTGVPLFLLSNLTKSFDIIIFWFRRVVL
jgi:tartrate dehydratase alpha subunit/fumarate hydratase class I-like protein